LWCGEIAGKINVFPLNENGVSGHQALCHSEEPNLIEDVKVARMCSNESHVFSCLYPGCMVYQWDVISKRIENKLDCSKLLPCSESLQSIAIDEHVNLIKCQISALAAHLGRGAFGFVFKANCKVRGARSFKPVAMKMLQPVPPGARAKEVSTIN